MANYRHILIVGAGVTGLSCVRYFIEHNVEMTVMDFAMSREKLTQWQAQYPSVHFVSQRDEGIVMSADLIVVSPGVDLRESLWQRALQAGIEVVGDIELFARCATAPIIAVTGSNGKTTVCTLCHQALQAAGVRVLLGGNIGVPALDLLQQPVPDYYLLELSSFQLETVHSLRDHIAVVINVSADHLDRYNGYSDYIQAKLRLYHHSRLALVNVDQAELTQPREVEQRTFSVVGREADYGVSVVQGEVWLQRDGKRWLEFTDAKLQGEHHWQNALIVMIIADQLAVNLAAVHQCVLAFAGVDHRCQWVRESNGVQWYNDSKATNEGAAVAAILTLSQKTKGNIILVAGGDAKQSSLSAFYETVARYVKHVVLLGQDAAIMARQLQGTVDVIQVDSLSEAVDRANRLAVAGDAVLLSPACSSLDMFDSYAHRGALFTQYVLGLVE